MLKSGHVWKKDEQEKKKNNRGAKLMISNEDWKLFNNPFQD